MNGRLRRLQAQPPSRTTASKTGMTNLPSRFRIVHPFVEQVELATQFYLVANQEVFDLVEALASFPHEAKNRPEWIATASNRQYSEPYRRCLSGYLLIFNPILSGIPLHSGLKKVCR
jgi:hypothetical protein